MSSDLESFLDTKLGERIQALIEIDELPIAEIELNLSLIHISEPTRPS